MWIRKSACFYILFLFCPTICPRCQIVVHLYFSWTFASSHPSAYYCSSLLRLKKVLGAVRFLTFTLVLLFCYPLDHYTFLRSRIYYTGNDFSFFAFLSPFCGIYFIEKFGVGDN